MVSGSGIFRPAVMPLASTHQVVRGGGDDIRTWHCRILQRLCLMKWTLNYSRRIVCLLLGLGWSGVSLVDGWSEVEVKWPSWVAVRSPAGTTFCTRGFLFRYRCGLDWKLVLLLLVHVSE